MAAAAVVVVELMPQLGELAAQVGVDEAETALPR
jgi:hypothetical protein